MTRNITPEQKELIKEIHRGNYKINLKGEVYETWADEFTGVRRYMGHLPRRIIPNRRRMEGKRQGIKDLRKQIEMNKRREDEERTIGFRDLSWEVEKIREEREFEDQERQRQEKMLNQQGITIQGEAAIYFILAQRAKKNKSQEDK